MPIAIVTDATGMTGHAIVKALAADPSTWTTVYALSRSQKGQDHKDIVHATVDLQSSAKDMATWRHDRQRFFARTAEAKSRVWVVTYPQDIIGFAKGNFMNLVTSTPPKTNAEFSTSANQTKGAANQAFNVAHSDTESWQDLWPKLTARFGCKVPPKMFEGSSCKKCESWSIELPLRPPTDEHAPVIGMQGKFRRNKAEQRIDLIKSSQRPEVLDAYKKLQELTGIEEGAWERATWGFVAFCLGRDYDCVVSMSKARRLGWTGYQKTWDAFEETFAELERAKMLPLGQK